MSRVGTTRRPPMFRSSVPALLVAVLASSAAHGGTTPPTLTETQRLAWDQSPALPGGAHFGATLASYDDASGTSLVFIGAPEEGAAQVYGKSALLPAWGSQVTLQPTTSQLLPVACDGFPLYAALDPGGATTSIIQANTGDVLLSGISGGPVASMAKTVGRLAIGQPDYLGGFGRVRIYEQACAGCPWAHAQSFVGPFGSRLGESLDIDGLVLVAGAPNEGDNGAVHIYARAAEWVELQVIDSPASGQTQAAFGKSLALDGDILAIGSPYLDRITPPPALTNAGGVYVYEVTTFPFLEFEIQALLRPPALTHQDWFGSSVDLMQLASGGVELVGGAPGDDGEADRSGAVYRYLRTRDPDATAWRLESRLVDGQAVALGSLGSTVAVGRYGILAGAPDGEDAVGGNSGVVLFFTTRIFADGFESGDTSAWSAVLP